MFTQKEIQSIDRSYFNVIFAGCYSITLQSKNTKHYWCIQHEEYPTFKTCQITHKHNRSDEYHPHRNQPTLQKAIQERKSHDNFQINVRDTEKRARRKQSAASSEN